MPKTTLTSPDSFSMNDLVELGASGVPSKGRVVATRDGGTQVYVLWRQRPGYDGKVTMEHAADLQRATARR